MPSGTTTSGDHGAAFRACGKTSPAQHPQRNIFSATSSAELPQRNFISRAGSSADEMLAKTWSRMNA